MKAFAKTLQFMETGRKLAWRVGRLFSALLLREMHMESRTPLHPRQGGRNRGCLDT